MSVKERNITSCANERKTFSLSITWFARALEVRRQRRELSQLDSSALSDLGISQGDRDKEIRRHFWDF